MGAVEISVCCAIRNEYEEIFPGIHSCRGLLGCRRMGGPNLRRGPLIIWSRAPRGLFPRRGAEWFEKKKKILGHALQKERTLSTTIKFLLHKLKVQSRIGRYISPHEKVRILPGKATGSPVTTDAVSMARASCAGLTPGVTKHPQWFWISTLPLLVYEI